MIQVTRINHLPLVLNSDLIEHLESTPDTVISLTNGQKLVVRESVDEVVKRVIEFSGDPSSRPEFPSPTPMDEEFIAKGDAQTSKAKSRNRISRPSLTAS